MTGRIPDPGSEYEDEGIPDHEGPLPEKVDTGDPQEGIAVPADEPTYSDDHGITAEEQAEGSTIDTRLEEEEPEQEPVTDPEDASAEPFPADEEERTGRIVEPDQGGPVDTEKDSVGRDVGADRGGFSPEERGMHLDPDSET